MYVLHACMHVCAYACARVCARARVCVCVCALYVCMCCMHVCHVRIVCTCSCNGLKRRVVPCDAMRCVRGCVMCASVRVCDVMYALSMMWYLACNVCNATHSCMYVIYCDVMWFHLL